MISNRHGDSDRERERRRTCGDAAAAREVEREREKEILLVKEGRGGVMKAAEKEYVHERAQAEKEAHRMKVGMDRKNENGRHTTTTTKRTHDKKEKRAEKRTGKRTPSSLMEKTCTNTNTTNNTHTENPRGERQREKKEVKEKNLKITRRHLHTNTHTCMHERRCRRAGVRGVRRALDLLRHFKRKTIENSWRKERERDEMLVGNGV